MNWIKSAKPYQIEKKGYWVLLSLCLILASAIKFRFIFQESLWPDEALYLYIARNLSSDLTNLTDIFGKAFYQSPPLLMYLVSLFAHASFLEFDQIARAVVVLMGVGTVCTTYFIGKKIYHPMVGIIAAGCLSACPLTNWNGVRILTDGPVVFFIYLAICMLVYEKKPGFYIIGCCAVLTKYSAFPVLFLPLLLRVKPRIWVYLYAGLFFSLFAFVTTKGFFSSPTGWVNYFYNFFQFPDVLHMVEETKFFLGYFLMAFAVVGMAMTVKEKKYSALFHWVCIFGIFRIFLPWVIFRVSRYTMPLYPALFIFAAYGCYESVQFVASRFPKYSKLATLFFVVSITSIMFQHSVKSQDLLNQTRNMFVGYNEASAFLSTQPGPHSVATASPRQMKYFGSTFDIYDIGPSISPENLRAFLEKNDIQYLAIDLWSPHLPEWCRTFDYPQKGYAPIYSNQKVYLFKVLKKV
ncbi:MAG: glycosyltransferase family 39 protein [Proteobacteria bacterium]|nr:glycosyltransferase family 39 protein [Pseudomonadota bacterium]MBU4470435.1 glycosyltransferase family 39 protein [Pseudomonadota bacterium]MCG2753488.1 glycosyltransferase family 39 protein [Desulfobacteraceae bacterium]